MRLPTEQQRNNMSTPAKSDPSLSHVSRVAPLTDIITNLILKHPWTD